MAGVVGITIGVGGSKIEGCATEVGAGVAGIVTSVFPDVGTSPVLIAWIPEGKS